MKKKRLTCTLELAPWNCDRGMTLVEIMLYVGVAALVIVGGALFLSSSLESRAKNDITVEVDTQGTQTMEFMTQIIRNAEDAEVITN
jgi:Tfp pilus assembly protein PilW